MTPARRPASPAVARREQITRLAVADEGAYHQARVLLVINAFTKRTRGIGDLERLIVFDSILRFPWILPRLVLEPHRTWPHGLEPGEPEEVAFEARYAPVRYGPWSDRYRFIVSALAGRNLITGHLESTRDIKITPAGRDAASGLARLEGWSLHSSRATFLYAHANISARKLDQAIREALNPAPNEGR